MKLWCWMFHHDRWEPRMGPAIVDGAPMAFGLSFLGFQCNRCDRWWPL